VTDVKPSKSARKREYQALQVLGEQLILLGDEELAAIQTDDYLIEQVRVAKKISAHGALRRQKQLIGKIMRDVDPEPIRAALAELGQADRHDKAVFKQAERWRDRIAAEGQQALQAFYAENAAKSPLLDEYVKDHDSAPDSEHQRQIRRKTFREIHRILANL
jgi:ribosome-associated protein